MGNRSDSPNAIMIDPVGKEREKCAKRFACPETVSCYTFSMIKVAFVAGFA